MAIAGCSSCSGDVALEMAQLAREAQMEQTRVSEALVAQNIALRVGVVDAEGVAENIDIAV